MHRLRVDVALACKRMIGTAGWAGTSKQIGQDGPAGLIVLPAARKPAGGAAHEQGGCAGALPAQCPAGQVLLPSPMPAEHKQAALPQSLG